MDQQAIQIATLVTVFGALLTAVYTSPKDFPYSIWDLLVSGGIITFCITFRVSLLGSPLFLTLARIALSVSLMLAIMSLMEAFKPAWVKKVDERYGRIFDGQFFIALALFAGSFLVY